jgi:hypothetical protein
VKCCVLRLKSAGKGVENVRRNFGAIVCVSIWNKCGTQGSASLTLWPPIMNDTDNANDNVIP